MRLCKLRDKPNTQLKPETHAAAIAAHVRPRLIASDGDTLRALDSSGVRNIFHSIPFAEGRHLEAFLVAERRCGFPPQWPRRPPAGAAGRKRPASEMPPMERREALRADRKARAAPPSAAKHNCASWRSIPSLRGGRRRRPPRAAKDRGDGACANETGRPKPPRSH